MGETELIELLVPDRFQLSRSITNIYGICVADIKTSIFEKKLRDYGQILSLKLQDNLFCTKLNCRNQFLVFYKKIIHIGEGGIRTHGSLHFI